MSQGSAPRRERRATAPTRAPTGSTSTEGSSAATSGHAPSIGSSCERNRGVHGSVRGDRAAPDGGGAPVRRARRGRRPAGRHRHGLEERYFANEEGASAV